MPKEMLFLCDVYTKWLEENNRKYVEGYFTRSLTKEAKDYFNIGPNYERLVQKQFNSFPNGQSAFS